MSRAGSGPQGADDPLFERRRQNHLRDLERAGEDPYGVGTPDPDPAAPTPAASPAPGGGVGAGDEDVIVFDQDPQVRLTLSLPRSVWRDIVSGIDHHPVADLIIERAGLDRPAAIQDDPA